MGRALDVYSRLPDSAVDDYKQLKQALLKRYNLTDEGYRLKFRQERPEGDESPLQFIACLLNYMKKWMSLAEVDDTSPAQVRDLFLREQFLEACPQDLAVFLQEKPLKSLEEVTEAADQFLTACNRQLHVTRLCATGEVSLDSGSVTHREGEVKSVKPSGIQCFVCGRYGHKAIDCRDRTKRNCFRCGKAGHEARNCRSNPRAGNTTVKSNCVLQKNVRLDSATEAHGVSTGDLEESIDDGCLLLANGKKVPLMRSAVSEELSVYASVRREDWYFRGTCFERYRVQWGDSEAKVYS